jgi:putative ABC transport system permease protein
MRGLADAAWNLRRRPLRSALTVAGIAIGVAALVLLGALAERLSRLVAGGRDFAAGQITVSGAGSGVASGMMRGALVTGDQLTRLAAVPGVRRVAPIVVFPVSDRPAALPFTLAPMVFGVDGEALRENRTAVVPQAASGLVVPTGADDVVLGYQVARHLRATTGDDVTVRGHVFHVVGVLEPTLTGPDSFVLMPYPTAQRLLLDSEPLLRRLAMTPGVRILPIATAAAVFWEAGEDPERVAGRIREALPGVTVASPAAAAADIGRTLGVLNALILGSALVAPLVAALAVTNTMFTAVVERRREIGLRRIVGATRRQVLAQLVAEAAVLGLAGSAVGVVAGTLAVGGLNTLTERFGAPVFLVTTRLLAAAAVVPAALAVLAGLGPAWRAAHVAPTDAIRPA